MKIHLLYEFSLPVCNHGMTRRMTYERNSRAPGTAAFSQQSQKKIGLAGLIDQDTIVSVHSPTLALLVRCSAIHQLTVLFRMTLILGA